MTSPSTAPPEELAPAAGNGGGVPHVPRVPWSLLGPDFIAAWGRPRGKTMPEHLEIVGPSGSGKTHVLVDVLLERVRRRKSACIFVATKQADETVSKLGWPVVDTWRGVTRHDQCVYWPRTKALGTKRKAFQAEKVSDLLAHLWQPEANTVVIFDEFAYIETLDADLKADLLMYLREGRSHGITVVAGKQRLQGVQREMHSETDWKFAFRMNDDEDNERLAQLFGSRRDWLPVIRSLNREKHEFLIQHKLTGAAFISWVDRPLAPPAARNPTGYRKAA